MSVPQRAAGQPICRLGDLEPDGARGFCLIEGDREINGFVVLRDNMVHAYLNRCPHAGNRLNWKPHAFLTRDRSRIMCAVHGALFEVASGVCIAGPCPGKALQRLEVIVEHGAVFLAAGVDEGSAYRAPDDSGSVGPV